MAYTKTTRAPNNDHLINFRKDYPILSTMQIASRFGVSENSICVWATQHGQRKPAPFWTVEAVKNWRKELEGNKPVDVAPAAPVKQVDSAMFLVTVPSAKIASFKNIITVLGGEVTDV